MAVKPVISEYLHHRPCQSLWHTYSGGCASGGGNMEYGDPHKLTRTEYHRRGLILRHRTAFTHIIPQYLPPRFCMSLCHSKHWACAKLEEKTWSLGPWNRSYSTVGARHHGSGLILRHRTAFTHITPQYLHVRFCKSLCHNEPRGCAKMWERIRSLDP